MHRKHYMSAHHPGGFTILELSMVIAVIGVLAMILLPALARSREAGRRAACMTNLAQIGMAMRIYADENNRQLPWSGGNDNAFCLLHLKRDAALSNGVFVCPSDAGFSDDDFYDYDTGQPIDLSAYTHELGALGLRGSYDYLGAYTPEPITLPQPNRGTPKIPVMWDKPGATIHHYSHVPAVSNVLWLDGSVTLVKSEEIVEQELPHVSADASFYRPRMGRPLGQDPFQIGDAIQ